MTDNVLICYGTRYGTTTTIVQEMVKTLKDLNISVDAVNLKKESLTRPVQDYDLVIVGSGIQTGKWTKEPLEFIESNMASLIPKEVALFVVCGDAGTPEKCDEAQADYLDSLVREYSNLSIISTGLFGGMFDFDRYNFVVRRLVKSIVKKNYPEDEELPEKLDYRDWEQIRDWTASLIR